MTEPPLVQTKLRPPQLASRVIERPRLTRRLDEHPGRVVLVSAPAGFGKTVAVVEWLRSLDAPVAWLSLDRFDNDFGRFRAHLAAAVEGLGDSAARATEIIAGLSGATGTDLPPALLDAFLEVGGDPVLVLDDLHEIEAKEVADLVEALVRAPAGCPHLTVLTREDPPFATGRLRVSGNLLELRAKDLRFTEEETVRLFEALLPGVLDAPMIRKLEERTEGWPAGLRLAVIALHDAEDPTGLAESFAGTHRFVTDYLLEEALSRQTPAIQQFLMETAFLPRFSRSSCKAIIGDPDAADHLAEVQQAGLFLVPLGPDGEWHRYHRLFADLLQYRLASRQPDRHEKLHARASEWFEEDGDLSTALEHAAAMRDQSRLLRLLDAHVLSMLGRGEIGALRYWMSQVREPEAVRRPMVLCLRGWLRVVTDRAPDLDSILDAIRSALERAPDDYDPDRRRQAEIHMDVLAAYAARYGRRYEEALEIHEAVQPRLSPRDPMTRGLLTYNTARVRMALAQMGEAAELLERAFEDHLRSANLYLTLATLGRKAAVIAQTEGVPAARESIEAAVGFTEERGLERHPAFSIVLYNRGFIELLANQLDRAEQWFRAALDLAAPADYPEERVHALVGLAQVAAAREAFDDAEAFLVEATALGQAKNADLGDSTLPLERTRLALAKELAGAGSVAPRVEPQTDHGLWTAIRETEHILAIRQALHGHDHEEAVPLVDELARESTRRERGPALVLALVALAQLRDPPEGWDVLTDALELGAARGYVRPFLDGGQALEELLRAAEPRLADPAAAQHARLLLDEFGAAPTPSVPDSGSLDTGALGDLLTDREAEVLAQLFEGLSNKAIARSLFVSLETVKTHLKHVYAKLDVTSRTRAVARARELGFSPEGASQPPERDASPSPP